MTDKLKQIIQKEVAKLPKETQEVIGAFDWVKISEEIGKKHLLNEGEINDLQVETLLILVGIENFDFYSSNVENKIGTSKNEAEKIADEVFQKIFTPIYNIFLENLKKSTKVVNSKPEQNLNFILSGGNYSAFIEQKDNADNTKNEEVVVPVFSIKEENFKRKFNI